MTLVAKLFDVSPGPFREAALVRDIAVDTLKVFDGIGHQVNIILYHSLLHALLVHSFYDFESLIKRHGVAALS